MEEIDKLTMQQLGDIIAFEQENARVDAKQSEKSKKLKSGLHK